MSRTSKSAKPPGYEYWGRRHGKRHGVDPGPFAKLVTHRRERQRGKREERDEP